jgi:hypothetical protein
MPAFIDIEASGLGEHSYPIEIGWVFPFGQERGLLIRPAASWTFWSAIAEEFFHQISRKDLLREGITVEEAVAQIEDALVGHEVYSEDPELDGWWLGRLSQATGHTSRIVLRDANALFEAQALQNRRDLVAVRKTAATKFPHVHRALPDALQMAEIWTLLFSNEPRLSRI